MKIKNIEPGVFKEVNFKVFGIKIFNIMKIKHIEDREYKGLNFRIFNTEIFNASYQYEDNNLHITGLYCEEQFRRYGMGTYVIRYIKNIVKENNKKTLSLDVNSTNDAAISCYEKNGFVCKSKDKKYYLMVCDV